VLKKQLILLVAGLSIPAFAGSITIEPAGGFSSDRLAPTVLTFSAGSNQIFGSNGSLDTAVRDYLTFTVPAGLALTAINMLDTDPLGNIGFIGLQAGNQLTLLPSTMTATGLLGWIHYTAANENTNILPQMGVAANGSTGFNTALPPGDYTLWIQDSSPGKFNYGFDVQLVALPEPATWATALVAIAIVILLRRRKRTA
jgi:hypothetical protein